ncbi:MAG: hypothetical protein DHS20C02_12440 [Micavibrio sp.]|nr:MAG: hypothetical protein DHS20C02_12440 [Micavibrio sp.]
MFSRFMFLSVLMVSMAFVFHSASAGDVGSAAEQTIEQPEEQESEQKAEAKPEPETKPEEENKSAVKMREAIKALAENLKPEERQHFATLYNNYNMVNTVKTVRSDVSEAIKACSKKNPDMKEKLGSRFAKWSEAVEPNIKESEVNINNMVFAQDYAPAQDIRNIFVLVDETRDYTASKFKKVPVTTPEACAFLLEKMDDTQSTMLLLLRATLVSHPQSIPAAKKEL